jgi:acyl carrier protein
MSDLRTELKQSIIEQLNLEELELADIDNNDPLFGDGLGLDSIDVLELIVMLEKDYGIKLTDPEEGKEIFASIDKMAEYIEGNRTK